MYTSIQNIDILISIGWITGISLFLPIRKGCHPGGGAELADKIAGGAEPGLIGNLADGLLRMEQQLGGAFLQPHLADIRGQGTVHHPLELAAKFAGAEPGQIGALGEGDVLGVVLVDELQHRT